MIISLVWLCSNLYPFVVLYSLEVLSKYLYYLYSKALECGMISGLLTTGWNKFYLYCYQKWNNFTSRFIYIMMEILKFACLFFSSNLYNWEWDNMNKHDIIINIGMTSGTFLFQWWRVLNRKVFQWIQIYAQVLTLCPVPPWHLNHQTGRVDHCHRKACICMYCALFYMATNDNNGWFSVGGIQTHSLNLMPGLPLLYSKGRPSRTCLECIWIPQPRSSGPRRTDGDQSLAHLVVSRAVLKNHSHLSAN